MYIYICVCAGLLTTAQNDTTSYNGTWDLITHVNQNMFINFIHTIYICLFGESPLFWALVLFVIWCHMYLPIYIYIQTWIFQVFLRPASNHRGKTYHIISDFRKRIWFQKKTSVTSWFAPQVKGILHKRIGVKTWSGAKCITYWGKSQTLSAEFTKKTVPSNKYHHIYVCVYIYVDIYIYIYMYILYQRRESWFHENLDFHCGRAETGHTLRHHRPWLHPIPSPWKPVMVEVMLPLKSRAFPANHLRLKGIDYINLYTVIYSNI